MSRPSALRITARLVATTHATLLLAASLTCVAIATQDLCTEKEWELFESSQKVLGDGGWDACELEYIFDMCDDACLARKTKRLEILANCTMDTKQNLTMYAYGVDDVDACKQKRNETKSSFQPKVIADLKRCKLSVMGSWESQYLPSKRECKDAIEKAQSCSDSCLRAYEQAIANAPACGGMVEGVWLGEETKPDLMRCLDVRGESVATNRVMTMAMGGSVSNATSSGTTTTTTTAPVTNRTKSPSTSDASASSVVSTVAIGGAILATMLHDY